MTRAHAKATVPCANVAHASFVNVSPNTRETVKLRNVRSGAMPTCSKITVIGAAAKAAASVEQEGNHARASSFLAIQTTRTVKTSAVPVPLRSIVLTASARGVAFARPQQSKRWHHGHRLPLFRLVLQGRHASVGELET